MGGLGERVGQRRAAVADGRRRASAGRAGGRARCSRCRRRARVGTIETPPTLMSRSLSLGYGRPATKAWAEHHRAGPARRAPGRRGHGASPRPAPPRGCGRAAPTARGARRARGRGGRGPRPGRARPRAGPACRRPAGVGAQVDPGRVDQPGRRSPSRRAESWLPVVSTTRAPRGGQPGERLVGQRVRRRRGAGRGRRRRRRPPRGRPAPASTTSTRWSTKAAWCSSMPTRWNERPRCQSEVWRIRTGPTLGRFQGHPWAPRQGCGRRDERLAGGRRAARAHQGSSAGPLGQTPAHDRAARQAGPRAAARRGAGVDGGLVARTVVAVLIHLRPLGSG